MELDKKNFCSIISTMSSLRDFVVGEGREPVVALRYTTGYA
jgi:hypothetical protein